MLVARLLRDQRGAVFVEYAIVLSLLSLGASLAVIALGSRLLELYRAQQAILLTPMP
jgi:Flp pilus assembly pilin Flp